MRMLPTLVKYVVAGLAAAVALAPQSVLACPVCFGVLDGPLADGANKAVLALLGITISVLVAFAAFFIHLVKRARAFEMASVAEAEANCGATVNRGNVMEGTA
jgi:hypothetical protein